MDHDDEVKPVEVPYMTVEEKAKADRIALFETHKHRGTLGVY